LHERKGGNVSLGERLILKQLYTRKSVYEIIRIVEAATTLGAISITITPYSHSPPGLSYFDIEVEMSGEAGA
jgi:hypothetical protein